MTPHLSDTLVPKPALDLGPEAPGKDTGPAVSRRNLFGAAAFAGSSAALGLGAKAAQGQERAPVDLTNFRDLLSSFVKTVGDLSGEQVCLWAHGSVYASLTRICLPFAGSRRSRTDGSGFTRKRGSILTRTPAKSWTNGTTR